jgi:hypothetical protein
MHAAKFQPTTFGLEFERLNITHRKTQFHTNLSTLDAFKYILVLDVRYVRILDHKNIV